MSVSASVSVSFSDGIRFRVRGTHFITSISTITSTNTPTHTRTLLSRFGKNAVSNPINGKNEQTE